MGFCQCGEYREHVTSIKKSLLLPWIGIPGHSTPICLHLFSFQQVVYSDIVARYVCIETSCPDLYQFPIAQYQQSSSRTYSMLLQMDPPLLYIPTGQSKAAMPN